MFQKTLNISVVDAAERRVLEAFKNNKLITFIFSC